MGDSWLRTTHRLICVQQEARTEVTTELIHTDTYTGLRSQTDASPRRFTQEEAEAPRLKGDSLQGPEPGGEEGRQCDLCGPEPAGRPEGKGQDDPVRL